MEENDDEVEVVKTGVEKENRMRNWNRTRNRMRKRKWMMPCRVGSFAELCLDKFADLSLRMEVIERKRIES